MKIGNLDFFKSLLPDETLSYYLNLLSPDETKNNEIYLLSFIDYTLKKNMKLNSKDYQTNIQNYILYCFYSLQNFQREKWYEEEMKWYHHQVKEEKKCLITLKRAFMKNIQSQDSLQDTDIPMIFLLVCALEEVRNRRVEFINKYATYYENIYKEYSLYLPTRYSREDIEESFHKIKEYTKEF